MLFTKSRTCRYFSIYMIYLFIALQVIKVVAKNRIGESNFITAIREALKEHFGDKVVGK